MYKIFFYFLFLFSCFLSQTLIFSVSSDFESISNETVVPPELIKDFIKKFNPKMLHILDYKKTEGKKVFLIRGNIPIINEKFCYDLLKSFIKDLIVQRGLSITNDFKIIDVSFLSSSLEEKEIQIEKNWFLQNPETGIFIHRPIHGTSINPLAIEEPFHNLLANKNIDGLRELIYSLKEIMYISLYPCQDTVIYIHCTAGKDRTGEVSAAYLMENKNLSYIEAIELNRQIAGRNLYINQANAICWYALYLREVKNCPWIGSVLDDNSITNLYNLCEN